MISAIMVLYNEEKIVERALKSIQGVVDEILVVHDGECTDKTIDICKKYGARVFVRPHIGLMEPHKAWLMDKAKGPWLLQIDADEFLSKDLQKNILKLTRDTSVSIYEFVWPSWDGKRYITSGWPHKKALYRKDKITFLALPHCEAQTEGKIVTTPYVLEHQPSYNNFTWQRVFSKWKKWAKIHAQLMKVDPQTYVRYPKKGPVIVPRYYLVKKFPLLLALPLGMYQGYLAYKTGGYKMGYMGLKISIMIMTYWTMFGLYLI